MILSPVVAIVAVIVVVVVIIQIWFVFFLVIFSVRLCECLSVWTTKFRAGLKKHSKLMQNEFNTNTHTHTEK